MYGSRSGSGAIWASAPASSGPIPSPPMLTMAARSVARARRSGGASSTSAAVAVPVKIPADSPESTRPRNSSGRPWASRNTIELAAATMIPGSSSARRP